MGRISRCAIAAAVTLLSSVCVAVTPGGPWFIPPLADRVVAYKIDAKYDAKAHTLDAVETLTYTNKTGQPLDRFPFHLYLNAFQPKSSWITEAHRNGQRDFGPNSGWDDKRTGSNEIQSIKVGGQELKQNMKFISPDDGNPNDRTVFEVQLPTAVPPNGTITFDIAFKAQFPEVIARTGWKRDYLLAAQWFPKVAVFWNGAWNAHQFHASTEFFADFGTYDVNITLPQNMVFGSTGLVTSEKSNGNGTKTISVHAEDVHDFAWTAAPNTKVTEDSIRLSTGDVKIRVLMEPGHEGSTQRYIDALKGTLKKFDEWYGPYPYPQITVVDPPHGAGGSGGMEYPMLITAGTSWYMPKSLLLPELVVEHEFGHQYWYGMVASNEFEDAWLDEGINSYTEVKIMDALYGKQTSVLNSRLGTAGESALQRLQYSTVRDYDPLTTSAWLYVNGNSYGGNTYGKTATILFTLEKVVGEEKMQKAIHDYFMKYRFKHPTEQDFMNSVNESVGQDLTWFWDQALKGTQTMDYRIMSARSDRPDWFEKKRSRERKGETMYQTEVVVHRKGTFVYPVNVEMKFDNGEVVREQWDGRDRWHRFTYDKKAKLVSAEIDPEHHATLDLDEFNNSHRTTPNSSATYKIASYFVYAAQWVAQLLAWLA